MLQNVTSALFPIKHNDGHKGKITSLAVGEISDKRAAIPYNVGQQIKLSVLVRYFILLASNGRNSHPQLLEWVNHE
jgi:hypothetical protein